MQDGQRGLIVDGVHTPNRRVKSAQSARRPAVMVAVLSALALVAGCSSVRPAKEAAPKGDPAALTVVAEIALERGDCKGASESYAKAAAVGAVSLARRATEVSLACEHLPAALGVGDALAYAGSRESRSGCHVRRDRSEACTGFRKRGLPSTISCMRLPHRRVRKAPGAGQQSDDTASDDDADRGAGAADKSDVAGLAPRKAGDRDVGLIAPHIAPSREFRRDDCAIGYEQHARDRARRPPESLSLLGDLGFEALMTRSVPERYAKQALERDPNDFAARRVLARAYVIRGDAAKAIATARESMQADPLHSTFELTEVLIALDRIEGRASGVGAPALGAGAPRPTSTGAWHCWLSRRGDLKEAQQRFSELASSGQVAEASLLYLADIEAREGDTDAAIAGYRRLYDSSVAIQARSRAASLLLARKDRKEALTLLDDYVTEHPESEFDVTLTKAHLLADHGEGDAGVELLTASLERHPRHPSAAVRAVPPFSSRPGTCTILSRHSSIF